MLARTLNIVFHPLCIVLPKFSVELRGSSRVKGNNTNIRGAVFAK